MNKKAQLDFDMDLEFILAVALGIGAGFISLIVTKSVHPGIIWKILTFIFSSAAGFAISYFILNK